MLGPVRDEAAPLIGHAHEQSLLMSLLDGAGERGQALLLRGDPGSSKSRLLSVAAQAARDCGMTVLNATSVQSEAQLPRIGPNAASRSPTTPRCRSWTLFASLWRATRLPLTSDAASVRVARIHGT